MISAAHTEQLKRFVANVAMTEAVYAVLQAAFIKTRNIHQSTYPSTEFLAAERIAADLFEAGWTDLLQFAKTDTKPEIKTQVGL